MLHHQHLLCVCMGFFPFNRCSRRLQVFALHVCLRLMWPSLCNRYFVKSTFGSLVMGGTWISSALSPGNMLFPIVSLLWTKLILLMNPTLQGMGYSRDLSACVREQAGQANHLIYLKLQQPLTWDIHEVTCSHWE